MKRDPEKPMDQRIWENGFDGHADAQLLRLAALSFREKVAWLEAMQKALARVSNAAARKPRKNHF